MRRGEIRLVDFEPVRGSEANKVRPAIIVSNDAANATAERLNRGVITVVPVTSNVAKIYGFQVLLPADETGLARDGKAQVEQLRAVAFERLGRVVGTLPLALIADLDQAIRIHLAV